MCVYQNHIYNEHLKKKKKNPLFYDVINHDIFENSHNFETKKENKFFEKKLKEID